MNIIIHRLCEYIINNKIRDIDVKKIVHLNTIKLLNYLSEQQLHRFEFNIRMFKKLVLYNYCFHYYIDGLTDEELIKINKYIHTNEELQFSVESNMLNFLSWCKKYNRLNTKITGIPVAANLGYNINNYTNAPNERKIYIVSKISKNITFR
jgi:hypothetical protein